MIDRVSTMLRGFVLILTADLIRIIIADELISARCQAKCLHDLELRYRGNPEQRRSLKHHIMQICKDDTQCSSCTDPCRKDFIDVGSCKETVCKDSAQHTACESSCGFLQKIFTEKPGACPKMKNQSTNECTALCHLDGDCAETSKCCSYGCSRQCVVPRKQDPRLMPLPSSVTVQERKRKRSVIIRWEMHKLNREQNAANSNLYVVQWRWGLQQQGEVMTDWQTVTVRNKPYAILKHLLSPGRFYQFRVAAVNAYGSVGFSKPSMSFKMSTEARSPSSPRNISLGALKLTPIGLWNQIVEWKPPSSDLPIKSYQLSWSVSSSSEANAFEEVMRRRATPTTYGRRSLDKQDEAWGAHRRERHSVIIPSHTTHSELSGLFPNSFYIVEIHATVDSSEGELHGEKGLIFVRTPNLTTSDTDESRTTDENGSDEDYANINVNIQMLPFDGQLQTVINWIRSPMCTAGRDVYVVRTTRGLCREYQPNHLLFKGVNEMRAADCSAKLQGPIFDCDYIVEIIKEGDPKTAIRCRFSTSLRDVAPSQDGVPCLPMSTAVYCTVHSAVTCRWAGTRRHNSTVFIGYRVALSTPMRDDTNISILAPTTTEIRYEELLPSTAYTLQVQPITNSGLGEAVETNFVTEAARFEESAFARFPGGEIIELPLESSSWSIFANSLTTLLPILYAVL